MKAILASNNPGKLKEMNQILSALGMEVLSQKQAGITLDVEETGQTFAENSLLKAEAVCRAAGAIAIADDSGLVVEALDGAPGVYSHRYGSPALDDAGRNHFLLQNMQGQSNRAAHFACVITCCFPDGRSLTAEGICPGEIAHAPEGENGFGYDPIFYLPQLNKTFAQLSDEEKNALSHRGKALQKLVELLQGAL